MRRLDWLGFGGVFLEYCELSLGCLRVEDYRWCIVCYKEFKFGGVCGIEWRIRVIRSMYRKKGLGLFWNYLEGWLKNSDLRLFL